MRRCLHQQAHPINDVPRTELWSPAASLRKQHSLTRTWSKLIHCRRVWHATFFTVADVIIHIQLKQRVRPNHGTWLRGKLDFRLDEDRQANGLLACICPKKTNKQTCWPALHGGVSSAFHAPFALYTQQYPITKVDAHWPNTAYCAGYLCDACTIDLKPYNCIINR